MNEIGIAYWQGLATSADSGVLRLSPDIARGCDAACGQYLRTLEDIAERVHLLTDYSGMGRFESGQQLAQKFSLKARGGVQSLEEVLRQHVEVVKAMQDFFRRFIADVEAQDADNASLIGIQEPN